VHRTWYRAVLRQVRSRDQGRESPADLCRDDQRAAEHAAVLRSADHPGGEARHHRLPGVDQQRAQQPRRLLPRWLRAGIRGPDRLDRRDRGADRCHAVDRSEGMTGHGGRHADRPGPGQLPGDADLSNASRDELVQLGSALDGVTIEHREDPFPVPGTRAEKRTERKIARWFIIAALAGLAFLAVYLFWPFAYAPPGTPGNRHVLYQLYTPIVGVLFGLAVFSVGAGTIAYSKHLLPHETAVQERHIGGSSDVDRATISAILADA